MKNIVNRVCYGIIFAANCIFGLIGKIYFAYFFISPYVVLAAWYFGKNSDVANSIIIISEIMYFGFNLLSPLVLIILATEWIKKRAHDWEWEKKRLSK
jgi:hypothetical protein